MTPESCWLWQFLRLHLILLTWAVLKNTGQAFCRVFHYQDLSDILFMIRLGLYTYFGEDGRGKLSFSFHYTSMVYSQHHLSLVMFTLIIWGSAFFLFVCLFLYYQVTFPPISIIYSLKGSHYVKTTLKEWEVMFHFLEGKISP